MSVLAFMFYYVFSKMLYAKVLGFGVRLRTRRGENGSRLRGIEPWVARQQV